MMEADGSVIVSVAISILATVLVLVLAWFSIRWLSRLNRGTATGRNKLRVAQSVAVGSRERVILLQDSDTEWLIGVTPGGIALLDRRPVTESPPDANLARPETPIAQRTNRR